MGQTEIGFNLLFFKRIGGLLRIMFPGWASLPVCLFFFLLVTSMLDQYFSYYTGLLSSKFFRVLVGYDYEGFVHEVIIAIVLIIGKSVILSSTTYTSNMLYVSWRQLICQAIHRLYLMENRFYKLNVLDLSIDNPDQRITQDVDKMSEKLSKILVRIVISPLTIAYYTYKTYMVTGYIGPLVVFSCFLLSTIVNKFLMSPIAKIYAEREKYEGNFRFKHMFIRVNSESIAFQHSERTELTKVNRRLSDLTVVLNQLYNHEFTLNVLVHFFSYFSAIISYIILAVPLFKGSFDGLSSPDLTALISANAFVTIYLVSQFSLFVDLSIQTSELAGTTHRVAELIENLGKLSDQETQIFEFNENMAYEKNSYGSTDSKKFKTENEQQLKFTSVPTFDETANWFCKLNNVTIFPPGTSAYDNIPLVKDLTMEIKQGENLIITGSSSCGKTSLLRVLRGLWPNFSGTLTRSNHLLSSPNCVMYLPQKPLLTDGTIMDQIIYPLLSGAEEKLEDSSNLSLTRWIELVGLTTVVQRYGGLNCTTLVDWYDALSPGEMQRINFLRLFYHRPTFAFLDESSSAISVDLERKLYEECARLNITVISVGHRTTLLEFHHKNLKIQSQGTWTLQEVQSENEQNA